MCMNNQFYPNKDHNQNLGFEEYLELFKSYHKLLDWLITEVEVQEDPNLMRPIRRAQFTLPLNV